MEIRVANIGIVMARDVHVSYFDLERIKPLKGSSNISLDRKGNEVRHCTLPENKLYPGLSSPAFTFPVSIAAPISIQPEAIFVGEDLVWDLKKGNIPCKIKIAVTAHEYPRTLFEINLADESFVNKAKLWSCSR